MARQRDYPSLGADEMIAGAREAGVAGIVAIAGATTPGEFSATLDIAERHDWIWAAAGIHPHGASEVDDRVLAALGSALSRPRVVALGEIGLDYHYNFSSPERQRAAFATQIGMARERSLPLVIHTREAEADTLAILRDEGAETVGGVIHCFSASEPFAHDALALGFYISFSGIITFPKADELRDVAKMIPEDRLLAETDSPFLSPVPFRGRPNEPARVEHVVAKLAAIRGISKEAMAALTERNARRCFRIA